MLTSVFSRVGLAVIPAAGPLVSILVPVLAEVLVTAIAQRKINIHVSID